MFKTIDPCWHTPCVRFLVATAALLTATPANAVLILQPNLILKEVQSFGGTVDSIPIPPTLTGGVTGVETGPITLSLDPYTDNVFGLDNVYQTGFIDVTLLLNSPLFTLLGETPRIRIIESGPASVTYADYEESGYDFTYLCC